MTIHVSTPGLIHVLVSWLVLTVSIALGALLVPGVSIRGGVISHFIVSATFSFVAWLVHALVVLLFGAQGVAAQYGLGLVARILVLAALVQLTSLLTQRLYVKTFIRAILMAIAVSLVSIPVEWAFGQALARWLGV